MIKKLKMLLKLRAWFKSRTLNVAAILGAIAGLDLSGQTEIIQTVIGWIMAAGVTQPTAIAILVAVKAIADAALRAKTDKSLDDK